MASKPLTLDHIALAVKDLEESVSLYTSLGLEFHEEREVVESQGVQVAFAPIDQVAKIELLAPINEEGPIAKFIEKKGPGIHHLCFQVEDVAKHCEVLKEKGMSLIYDSPRPGAGKTLVNFIHPKSTGGVLIELSQNL